MITQRAGYAALVRLLLGSTIALLLSPLVVAAESIGRVALVLGEVDAITLIGERRPLDFGDQVQLGDTIVTGDASQLKLLLRDDSVLKVGPNSQIRLSEQLVGGDSGSGRTTVDLLRGRLRSVIGHTLKPGAYFRVNTDVAVAGVRGTDFESFVRGRSAAFRTFEGVVAVRHMVDQQFGMVELYPNTFTVVLPDRPPMAPLPIAPDETLERRASGMMSAAVEKSGEVAATESTGDEMVSTNADQARVESSEVEPLSAQAPLLSFDQMESRMMGEMMAPSEAMMMTGTLESDHDLMISTIEAIDTRSTSMAITDTVIEEMIDDESASEMDEPLPGRVRLQFEIELPAP